MRRELYSRRGGRGYWNCCACMLKNEEKTVFLDLTWEILAFGRFLGEVESWKTSCTAQKKRGVRTLHLSNVRITSNGLLKILLALFECGTRAAALCCALLWLRSYLMSRDLFTNARMETLPFCYWTATSLSNYRNGKNPSLQSRPQLLPSPSFTCRGRRQKKPHKVIGALKKVFPRS